MEYLKKRNILAALKELITISWGGKTGKYQGHMGKTKGRNGQKIL